MLNLFFPSAPVLLAILIILFGLSLLIASANVFIDAAANTAHKLKVPPLIIGLIIVGFATSAPEIIVGIDSAIHGKIDIAIGNALGSNIANIGLILGVSALLFPFEIHGNTIKKEYLLMFAVMLIPLGLMWNQWNLSRIDAAILILCLLLAFFLLIKIAKNSRANDPVENQFTDKLDEIDKKSTSRLTIELILSLLCLLIGADLLVGGSVSIAKNYGVSDLIIGLTIVAVGTSLPEIATSITSIIKGNSDMAIGNIIGSNIFNMLAVLGIPALIQPATTLDMEIFNRDFPTMLLLSMLLAIMLFSFNKVKLSRSKGTILLLFFIMYQFFIYQNVVGL